MSIFQERRARFPLTICPAQPAPTPDPDLMFVKILKTIAVLSVALGLTSFQAKADLIYDNGPILGTHGYTLDYGYEVTDSFTVSSATTLTSVEAGLWTLTADVAPASLDWSIGTSEFGSEISSGTASTISSVAQGTSGSYTLYDSSFAVTGLLSAGTYYLTLEDASPAPTMWDESDGSSTAYENVMGQIGSESFQVYGSLPPPSSNVPDGGSTLAMLGLAMAGLACARRKLGLA